MSTQAVAEAIEAWAAENSTATAYPNEPASYGAAFPMVAASIRRDDERVTDESYPQAGYQQIHVQILVIQISILVDPDPAWSSDQELYAIVDDLKDALKADSTLGQRVEDASPLYRVNYDGEAETSDGTRANLARMEITVARKVSST